MSLGSRISTQLLAGWLQNRQGSGSGSGSGFLDCSGYRSVVGAAGAGPGLSTHSAGKLGSPAGPGARASLPAIIAGVAAQPTFIPFGQRLSPVGVPAIRSIGLMLSRAGHRLREARRLRSRVVERLRALADLVRELNEPLMFRRARFRCVRAFNDGRQLRTHFDIQRISWSIVGDEILA